MKAILSILVLVTFVSVLFACVKQTFKLKQTVTDGSFIQTINGKNLIWAVAPTALNARQIIMLICTNKTETGELVLSQSIISC